MNYLFSTPHTFELSTIWAVGNVTGIDLNKGKIRVIAGTFFSFRNKKNKQIGMECRTIFFNRFFIRGKMVDLVAMEQFIFEKCPCMLYNSQCYDSRKPRFLLSHNITGID